MSLLPIPRGVYSHITDLKPEKLKEKGITLVLADLDNTLAPYRALTPTQEIVAWRDALEAEGITLFVLSNNRKPARVIEYSEKLNVPFQPASGKPKRAGFRKALERMGRKPEETVMVGDQIFTDILGAVRAGITPILVQPIQLAGNPGRYIRYAVELPFRLAGRGRPFL